MKQLLTGIAALCLVYNTQAQNKTFDLYVVAEGNFGTPNGDVYKASRTDSVTLTASGPLYQTANSIPGIDVLQDYGVFGNRAVLCGKGASSNPVRLAIVAYPSFDTIKTFQMAGIQCLGKASDTKGYVGMATGSSIQMLDLQNNTLTPVSDPNSQIGSFASYMAQGGSFMYVAMGSKIVKIDTATNTAIAGILPGIGTISSMEYDPDNNCIWLLGKVSGTSAIVKLTPGINDVLQPPVLLTGITNAAQLRYAQNTLYFLSGKSVHTYHIASPNIPTTAVYTSTLTGSSFSFAYGKSFCVDPVSGDFALATAGNFAQPSQYEIVDGSTFQQIDTGSVNGRIANELILRTYTTPVPDTLPLPDVYASCSITLTPPTAMAGNVTITGTTTDPINYDAQGVYTVTWTFTYGNNTTTHTQQVTVQDTTAPVPDAAVLPAVLGHCPYTLTAPAATDNCMGAITATTDSLLFTVAGNYTINWRYDDGHGNITTQQQQVQIDCPTGIAGTNGGNTSVTIYPNPASSTATVTLEQFTGKSMQLRVSDALGRTIHRQTVVNGHNTLQTGTWQPGLYYMTIYQDSLSTGKVYKLSIR